MALLELPTMTTCLLDCKCKNCEWIKDYTVSIKEIFGLYGTDVELKRPQLPMTMYLTILLRNFRHHFPDGVLNLWSDFETKAAGSFCYQNSALRRFRKIAFVLRKWKSSNAKIWGKIMKCRKEVEDINNFNSKIDNLCLNIKTLINSPDPPSFEEFSKFYGNALIDLVLPVSRNELEQYLMISVDEIRSRLEETFENTKEDKN